MCVRHSIACVVPPDLLKELLLKGSLQKPKSALDTLTLDSSLRLARTQNAVRAAALALAPRGLVSSAGKPRRAIYDQKHSTTDLGELVRGEGQPATKDASVNQAYDGFGHTYDFYWKVLQRDSIDGAGMPIAGLVHYGIDYDNAFWDGEGHMFFGDGDNELFTDFTKSIDVIGHELTHGVTQYTANLHYSNQSGALNESLSDCMGSVIKQRAHNQSAAEADWLIGAEVVGPKLRPALRSMKDPGTANAYDRQPATMDKYVKTADDNGGVHTNSGIPNKAFYLAAIALGGNSWDKAAPIWYAAMRDPQVKPNSSFRRFAHATVRQASQMYGQASKEALAVEGAWKEVKVLK